MIDQDARAKIISELMELQDRTGDIECAHAYADNILCELLKKLGFADVVDAWEAVPKWYA
jgi:hypothetical protein